MATSTMSNNLNQGRMPQRFRLAIAPALVLGACLAVAGCSHAPLEAPLAPPQVTVSYAVDREVTDYADFTARTAAVDSVELRARVSGYLDKVNFKEGALVKKGDVLFEIDPRPYQAALKQAQGQLATAEAKLNLAEYKIALYTPLVKKGTISQEDMFTVISAKGEAIGTIDTVKGKIRETELNIGFCTITAPVSGRVSRAFVTVGNLVQAGDLTGGTLLTTVVSVDPMYAYFDVGEHTVLRVKQLIREGKAKTPDDQIPVWLGLANEQGHPHRGVLNFVDNQVNPRTGTLRVRGVFDNKDEALSPGYFTRVRVPIGVPHQALLVSERALDTDQGQKIVYAVDKDNKVLVRPVRLGALHDGLREITDGLAADERIIVNGLQQVRPGMTVEAKLVPMPASETPRANATASPSKVASSP